jgi:hypothetical protein
MITFQVSGSPVNYNTTQIEQLIYWRRLPCEGLPSI